MLPIVYARSPGPCLPTSCACAYLCISTCHGNHMCWLYPVPCYSVCAYLYVCMMSSTGLPSTAILLIQLLPDVDTMHRIAGQPTLNLLTARTSAVLHSINDVVLLCAGADGGGCGARPWTLSKSTLWLPPSQLLPSLLASCCCLVEDDD